MLDINFIRENSDLVKQGIGKKKTDPKLVDRFLRLDEEWRSKTTALNELASSQKKLSKEIAEVKTEDLVAKAQVLKKRHSELEVEVTELKTKRDETLYLIPNLPLDDVPVGKDESENSVLREWGERPKFDFKPKDHLELGNLLGLIDTEKAASVSGSRFGYLMRDAVMLEFALVSFAMKTLTDEAIMEGIASKISPDCSSKPFVPVVPPVMIRPEVFTRMARLNPGEEEERFHLEKDNLYLVGSAEHTLGPLHMDEVLSPDVLPIRYVGFSTSFRREAGSYGRDTRGIFRVHQFDKIEMESFTTADKSRMEQDFIIGIQEYLLQSLKLPYRVMSICTGDMGAPDARQVDLDVWLPGQDKYRELQTSDMMTDYQARRLGTRVKKSDGTLEYVHMNDATAFAIGRTLIAILENYQTAGGSVMVPEVLQDFVGKKEILPR